MKITKGAALAVAACCTLLVSTACTGGGKVAGASSTNVVNGGTLNIAMSSDPGNLDPQRSAASLNIQVALYAYDAPVTVDKNNQVVPEVVTAWKSTNTQSYVLTVKQGVTCSDGSAMDAKTVADNISYVGDDKNQSALAGVAVPSGAVATADPATNTVTVALSSPSPFFLENLALLPLICENGLANRKILATQSDGSGPFVVSEDVVGDHITYTARKGYNWGPSGASTSVAGFPATLNLKVVSSDTTTANLMLSGQLNVSQVQGSDQDRLKAAGLYSTGPSELNDEITFNQAAGLPTSDVVVRRALVMALNLPDLAKVDTAGQGQVATGLIAAPKVCGGDTLTGNLPSFDLTKAESQLDQDGWKVGSGGVRSKGGKQLSISLVYGSTPATRGAAAEYIASKWKALGVDVSLNQKPEDDAVNDVVDDTIAWDAFLEGITIPNPSVIVPFLSGDVPPKGSNFANIQSTEYNSLVAKASTEPGTTGCADWNAAESALFRDADIVPFSVLPSLVWGKNATFVVNNGELVPASLRVLR